MMETPKNFHHDDLLGRAVDAVLRDPTAGDLSPDQVAQLVAIVRQAADEPYPITIIERIKNMRLRTRIAVAATILIAFFGLMSLFVPGSGAAIAFADVAEALNNVHSATWKTTTVVQGEGPQGKTVTYSANAMFLAPSHERTETTAEGGKGIQIVDGRKGKVIALEPATKNATLINLKDFPPESSPFGRTFQSLRELVASAQSGKAGKVERLGTETIDGRTAEGFHIQVGAIEVKIWADPKTLLPIRVKETTKPGAGPEVCIVMTDFQVNVPLDESLFSVDVPPGYTVQETAPVDASKSPWAYLADALKMAAEYNDGVFPPTLRGEQGIDGIIQRGAKAFVEKHRDASPAELRKVATDVAMKLGGAFGVLFALPPDAWHYAGKDVKLGTPNRPILWLQQKKGGQCMVIYADLSIKEVSSKEALTFPQSEGGSKPQGT